MTPRTERGYQSLVMQTAKRFQHFWVGFSGDGDVDVMVMGMGMSMGREWRFLYGSRVL